MLEQRKYNVLIILGVQILVFGADGALVNPFPSNKAVLNGTRTILSCASNNGFSFISWSYLPVGYGGSDSILIATGSSVIPAMLSQYSVNSSKTEAGYDQSNLIILSATPSNAGSYFCTEGTTARMSAELIVINSEPLCTSNVTSEVVCGQILQMTCTFSYTAHSTYVSPVMSWSSGNSTIDTTTSGNLTTAVSTNNQQAEYTPNSPPTYNCNTTFKMNDSLPNGSDTKAPEYSKISTPFSSPVTVNCIKGATVNVINGSAVYLGTPVTCKSEANPSASYSWFDVTYGNTTNTSTIQIWHDGKYICKAWNKVGNVNESVNLTTYMTTSISTTEVASSSTEPNPDEASPESNVGMIVGIGIAVGIIVVTGVILFVVFFVRHQRAKQMASEDKQIRNDANTETSSDNAFTAPQYEALQRESGHQATTYEELRDVHNIRS